MDFGSITMPTSWDDITLRQFVELTKIYEKEDKELLDILALFSGKDKSELKQMPKDFIDTMLIHLQFLNTPLNVEPQSEIVINGKKYMINYKEKLKFGEFTDAETVIRDKDYASMLAILCRQKGEIYDDDFIADKLDDRVEMFNSLSIREALMLLNFFLKLGLSCRLYSLQSLETSKAEVEQFLQSIENSLKDGDGNWFDILCAKIRLRSLRRQIRSI